MNCRWLSSLDSKSMSKCSRYCPVIFPRGSLCKMKRSKARFRLWGFLLTDKKDDAIYFEAGFFFRDWYIGDLPQQNIPSIFWSHLNICLFCFLSQALCDMERNAGNKRLSLLYKVSWLQLLGWTCLDYRHASDHSAAAIAPGSLECIDTQSSSRLIIASLFGKLPHKNPRVISAKGARNPLPLRHRQASSSPACGQRPRSASSIVCCIS